MSEREVSLTVDPADILPLIKQFLYAEREVFLRELISNALDALTRVDKTHRLAPGFVDDQQPLRVEIHIDPARRQLIISDNGDGMSEEEVLRNINQIAFSGARKFVEENARTKERMIGRFGVGFYSAFMVAVRVEIDTWSWRPGAGGCHWSSEGGTVVKLGSAGRRERGTVVICHLQADADEFLKPERIAEVVRRYLDFAPYPIFVGEQRANLVTAPWHLGKHERDALPRQKFTELFARLNPAENEPLAWLDVEIDYPVDMRALLFVPDRGSERPGKVRLYSNRVFVCEHVEGLLPSWLSFLDGTVDSTDLPVNVSRERFQLDRRFRLMGQFLTTKSVETLGRIARDRRKDYMTIWERHGLRLKRGYLESGMQEISKLTDKLESMLLFTTDRQTWTTLAEYQARLREPDRQTFLYLTDERNQSAHLQLWQNRNREVLFFTHPLDIFVLELLKKSHPDWSVLRIDETKLEPRSTTSGDGAGDSRPVALTEAFIELMRTICGPEVGRITVKSLPSYDIPAVLQVDADGVQREFLGKWMDKGAMEKPVRELSLNSNSPLIQRLLELTAQGVQRPLLGALAVQLWDNVRLNAGLLSHDDLLAFARRNAEFLALVAHTLSDPVTKSTN